jgi:hypothetical protein
MCLDNGRGLQLPQTLHDVLAHGFVIVNRTKENTLKTLGFRWLARLFTASMPVLNRLLLDPNGQGAVAGVRTRYTACMR